MKSFTGKFASARGWVLLIALLFGAGMMISACGDEEVPAPTTPTPPPPAPPPAPEPEPEPEPTGPATPENLRVAATTSNSITWTWDAVEGVLGYQGQFSPDATFTDTDATFIVPAPLTSHTIANLDANTTGHFRVRSGVGTAVTDLTFSDWTEGVSGSTAAPPPATALDAPGGVTTSVTDDSVTVSWDEVDDAESYEVQYRLAGAGGNWSDADCGDDGIVDGTSCVVSDLDEVTGYDFRVRAVPSSGDTQFSASDWVTLNNVETTGTRATPPPMTVSGGEDDLNMVWESTATSITWRWDQVADRDRMYQIHYTEEPYNTKANPCIEPDDTNWALADAAGFATSFKSDTTGVDTFTPDLEAGDVALLCVQTTWEDDRGVTQYGNHSFAWAATTPTVPSLADPAYEDKDGDTKKINWMGVSFDQGFKYELRLVSASPVEDGTAGTSAMAAGPDQAACAAGTPLNDEDSGNRAEFTFTAYDVAVTADYTSYHLCYMARNEDGTSRSEWAISSNGGVTLPSQPGSIGGVPSTVDHDDGLEWSFAVPADGHPQEAASYNVFLFQEIPEAADADPKLSGRRALTAKDCEATGAIRNTADDGDIYAAPAEITSGVTRTRTHIRVVVPTGSVTDAGTGPSKRNYLCVQSKIANDRVSKWRLSGSVTQRKDPGS